MNALLLMWLIFGIAFTAFFIGWFSRSMKKKKQKQLIFGWIVEMPINKKGQ